MTKKSQLLNTKSISSHAITHSHQDSWLAVNFSLFFPGIGQIYAGKFFKGVIWAILQGFVLIFGFWSIFSPLGKIGVGLVCLGIGVAVYLVNLLDALLTVYWAKNDKTIEKIPRMQKNPWFAVFTSRILPGLGHLYSGQSILGVLLLATFLIVIKLTEFFPILLIIPPLLTAIAVYHVYLTFPAQYHPHKLTDRSLLAIMVGIIFAWGLISTYLPSWLNQRLELFTIPSESMQPTLQIDDRIFVYKSENYTPQRKDIIVFKTPYLVKQLDPTSGDFYIKRVIAKPGEIVFIHNGKVYINNQPLEENYTAQPPEYEWGPATVAPDSYFVLGDNRNASFDSHAWGFLPKANIYGQAYKIYWPLGRVQSLLD